MEREALKLALEALEAHADIGIKSDKAIAAIKEALAQPAQEPVAWMVYTLDGASVCVTDNSADFTPEHRALPLYTTPPKRPWVGLTDKELNECVETPYVSRQWANIEAKLKEKNT